MMTPFCAQCQARFGWCEYDPATDTLYASDGGECPERMETMMENFDLEAFAQEVHKNAVAHGWWDEERSEAEVRALIHSEWSEALEEAREGRPMLWHECMDAAAEPGKRPVICDYCTDCVCKKDQPAHDCAAYNPKPEGVAVELMDGVIRILDVMAKEDAEVPNELMRRAWPKQLFDPGEYTLAELVTMLHYEIAHDYDGTDHRGYKNAVAEVFAWVRAKGLDPVKIMLRKHRYNVTRPYKHGKRF